MIDVRMCPLCKSTSKKKMALCLDTTWINTFDFKALAVASHFLKFIHVFCETLSITAGCSPYEIVLLFIHEPKIRPALHFRKDFSAFQICKTLYFEITKGNC